MFLGPVRVTVSIANDRTSVECAESLEVGQRMMDAARVLMGNGLHEADPTYALPGRRDRLHGRSREGSSGSSKLGGQ